MKSRIYWGLAILIVLLTGIGIGMLMRGANTEPVVIYKPPTQADIDQANKHIQSQLQVRSAKKPADEPGYTWVWHNDHWDKIPIAQTPKTPIVPVKPFEVPKTSGNSLYSRVAASDRVPTYEELKAMSQDELRELMEESYAKAKSYDPEVNRRWDAWAAVPVASDKGEVLEASLDAVLKEQFVHSATGSKAFEVLQWRFYLQLQDNPLPNYIIMPIPEPFDP